MAVPPADWRRSGRGGDDFDVTVGTNDGETVVSPHGELDMLTAPQLRTTVEGAGDNRVVIDFTDVDFMNSTGLSVLIALTKRLRSAGGDLRLRNIRPPIQRMLTIAGVDRLLTIE